MLNMRSYFMTSGWKLSPSCKFIYKASSNSGYGGLKVTQMKPPLLMAQAMAVGGLSCCYTTTCSSNVLLTLNILHVST